MTHLRAQVAVDAAPHCGQRSSRTGRDKEDAAAAFQKHWRRVFRFLRVHARLEHQLTRSPFTRMLLATNIGHSHGSLWSHIRSIQTYDQEGVSASNGLGSAVGCLRLSISVLCVPGRSAELSSKMGCWSSSASLKDMETRRTSSDVSARELRPAAVLTSVLLDDVPTCQT